jgi:hypothetical protein
MKCFEYSPIGGFVEQKLVLSYSFWCEQIGGTQCYESGHSLLCTLKCDLDVQHTTGLIDKHLSLT